MDWKIFTLLSLVAWLLTELAGKARPLAGPLRRWARRHQAARREAFEAQLRLQDYLTARVENGTRLQARAATRASTSFTSR